MGIRPFTLKLKRMHVISYETKKLIDTFGRL